MAASWELSQHKSMMLGILHVETTTVAWALGLRNLQIPGPVVPVSGMPYDMARNALCMKALEMGVDYLGFLDSDTVPPRDAFMRLIAHDLPIVSGLYCRRSPPHGIPVMLKDGQWITQFPRNKLLEVHYVGAGCLVIRRDVLEKLPPIDPQRGKHWFDWRVDMGSLLPPGEALSEDFSFNLHARKHGFPVMVDTSIVCRHIGFAEAGIGTFVPCETTPAT